MSGGSYDYLYSRLSDAARTLRDRHPGAPHVLALATLLARLSDVMYAIEWADSADTSWDDALDAKIRALLAPGAELGEAIRHATEAHTMLTDALGRARETIT